MNHTRTHTHTIPYHNPSPDPSLLFSRQPTIKRLHGRAIYCESIKRFVYRCIIKGNEETSVQLINSPMSLPYSGTENAAGAAAAAAAGTQLFSSIFSAENATTWKVAAATVAGVTMFALLSKLGASDGTRYTHDTVRHVRNYIQSSTQNAAIARQSTNPVIALMHMNYAVAYAMAARELVTSKEDIARMTGVKIDELMFMLKKEQMQYHKAIHAQCPAMQPEGAYAVATGWIGSTQP